MTIKSITATFHHPYPQYRWEFRREPDTDSEGWQELLDDNYGDLSTGYVPADQGAGLGRTTNSINLTSPQQGRDEAWFRCVASSGSDIDVVYSDSVYVAIGPLEWTVNLTPETKTIEATLGPVWSGDMDVTKPWDDTPATHDLTTFISASLGELTFADNETTPYGTILGNIWTAPDHGAAPGVTAGRVDALDDNGRTSSPLFSMTVEGKMPTVTIADPGTISEGSVTPIVATVVDTDEGAGAGKFWSFSAPGVTTALTGVPTLNTYTITPDTSWNAADVGNFDITVTYRAYTDDPAYSDDEVRTITVQALPGPQWDVIAPQSQSWLNGQQTIIADLDAELVEGAGETTFSHVSGAGSVSGDSYVIDASDLPDPSAAPVTLRATRNAITDDVTFNMTVSGKTPSVTITDPGAVAEGSQTPVTAVVTNTDAGAAPFWSWDTPGFVTVFQSTNTDTITPDATGWVADDNTKTLTATYRAYEDDADYEGSDTQQITVTAAQPPVWDPTFTDAVPDAAWADSPATIPNLKTWITDDPSDPNLTFEDAVPKYGTITLIPGGAGQGIEWTGQETHFNGEPIAFSADDVYQWDGEAHGATPGDTTGNVVARNAAGTTTSPLMTATVTGTAPTVTISGDQTVEANDPATFTSSVSGTDATALDYTWDVSGLTNSDYTGEASETLSITRCDEADTGAIIQLEVRAYDTSDNWLGTSNTSELTVNPGGHVYTYMLTIGTKGGTTEERGYLKGSYGALTPTEFTEGHPDAPIEITYITTIQGSSHIRMMCFGQNVGEANSWVNIESDVIGHLGVTPVQFKLYLDVDAVNTYWKFPVNPGARSSTAAGAFRDMLNDSTNFPDGTQIPINIYYKPTFNKSSPGDPFASGNNWPWSDDGEPAP